MAEKTAEDVKSSGDGVAVQPRKFWDGFRWVEQFPASVDTNSNPVTRKDRRLYLGNLPPGLTADQVGLALLSSFRPFAAK